MNDAPPVSFRPLAEHDLDSVPLECQGEPAEVRERVHEAGSSAMLAFAGERRVAQLHFRPLITGMRSPQGIYHPLYWMDYPAATPSLPECSLCLFCFHVGQVDSTPEHRDLHYLGRGIGQRLLRETLVWAGEHGFRAVVAKGLAPCWPVLQYMGGMPWSVYERYGFTAHHAYHDEALRGVLDELLDGAYGPRRLMEMTEAVEGGADLDALSEVRIYVRLTSRQSG